MQYCFCRLGDEGNSGFTNLGITANHQYGDWLIAGGGDVIISFQHPVRLVGTQLTNNYGGPFIAEVQAFNNNKLLATFTENGRFIRSKGRR
jgi:hypothetical protein